MKRKASISLHMANPVIIFRMVSREAPRAHAYNQANTPANTLANRKDRRP
jgi:hypothetical protein